MIASFSCRFFLDGVGRRLSQQNPAFGFGVLFACLIASRRVAMTKFDVQRTHVEEKYSSQATGTWNLTVKARRQPASNIPTSCKQIFATATFSRSIRFGDNGVKLLCEAFRNISAKFSLYAESSISWYYLSEISSGEQR